MKVYSGDLQIAMEPIEENIIDNLMKNGTASENSSFSSTIIMPTSRNIIFTHFYLNLITTLTPPTTDVFKLIRYTQHDSTIFAALT